LAFDFDPVPSLAFAAEPANDSPPAADKSAESFELRDGDRIVLLGNTLVERDQAHGFLETTLTERFHGRRLVFRNLGWSGDTVWGEARALFGTPADGYQSLKESVAAAGPTVIFVGYGTNESFAGAAGLPRFVEQFNRLLDELDRTKARIVLLSPLREEDLGRPLPDPTEQNERLKVYTDAIRQLAAKRGYRFVDLFDRVIPSAKPPDPTKFLAGLDMLHRIVPLRSCALTDDEMHLTERGYYNLAEVIETELLGPKRWSLSLDMRSGKIETAGCHAMAAARPSGDSFRLSVTDDRLPLPFPPTDPSAAGVFGAGRTVQVAGLPAGRYGLSIGGKSVAVGNAAEWGAGISVHSGPSFDAAEQLRLLINRKNRLFFSRWRPENVTYLFLFRKHEQGQNAVEIPKFDPLVAEAERQILVAAVPLPQTYELKPVAPSDTTGNKEGSGK